MSVDADAPVTPGPRYARFSPRLRAIMLDSIIILAVIAVALLAATSIRNDDFSRVLGWVMVIILLLYEPILVSATGGTLGHYFNNLRVVDDRDGGNVSFLKACVRHPSQSGDSRSDDAIDSANSRSREGLAGSIRY
jgi:uncharacterized RDD family membrane protein YckC